MNVILIAIHSTDANRRYTDLEGSLQELGGGCFTFEGTWIVRTELTSKDVYGYLEHNIVNPNDQFIVAPLSEPWLAYKCRSFEDCWRF